MAVLVMILLSPHLCWFLKKKCFVIGDLSLLIVVYFHDRFLQIQIKKGYTALCTQVISFLFEIPMCVINGVQQGYDK